MLSLLSKALRKLSQSTSTGGRKGPTQREGKVRMREFQKGRSA